MAAAGLHRHLIFSDLLGIVGEDGHFAWPRRGPPDPKSCRDCNANNVAGLAARTTSPCYSSALGSIGSQMLILRVSGIKKRASRKHTAGTAIG